MDLEEKLNHAKASAAAFSFFYLIWSAGVFAATTMELNFQKKTREIPQKEYSQLIEKSMKNYKNQNIVKKSLFLGEYIALKYAPK